ncbi:hypothetical protein LTR56_020609 [Elasticomyces elasticus]|nr:hypothetical protein LTR56_020609 [Elasticomyces elasticus]KAK3630867.1 hypothetical protein LTR22_021319 [Elasticomyces elasticus]KAK4909271.1 hypothetical protein LTR49_021941 [Elasticomyces elasticus]KAK5753549.1 hypothetical protein LTS12_016389 [Elasticomyces elasticus]
MASTTVVGLLGATGETGTSIVNGLLEAGGLTIIALTRPSSVSKPAAVALKDRGVEIRALDLKASQDDIVTSLKGVEVLISAIGPMEQLEQIPLATAAKTAGVKRFLPCGAMPVVPAGGIHMLRDVKEIVYNHIKTLHLPYTIVDVGWWYQIAFPPLPSGKIDYALGLPNPCLPGDGSQPNALTDLRDIGRYFAKIVVDDRTINKYVFVYNELHSPTQIFDLMEKLSGEKLDRQYDTLEELQAKIADARPKIAKDPTNFMLMVQQVSAEYLISWGIRGDNQPEYAKYLGYVTSKELYPDFKFKSFEAYLRDEVMAGKAKGVYDELRAKIVEMHKTH